MTNKQLDRYYAAKIRFETASLEWLNSLESFGRTIHQGFDIAEHKRHLSLSIAECKVTQLSL